MRRLVLIAGLAATLFVVGAGCITPSIPIPPPDPTQMRFAVDVDADTATFSYPPADVYVGSIVFVYNRDRGVGVIEDAHPDGSVGPTAPFAAIAGDQVVISFQRTDQTVSTCIRLRDGAQSPTDFCGL